MRELIAPVGSPTGKTIKIRIKDSKSAKRLHEMARTVNFVWNYCNETSEYAIRNKSEWLSGYKLQKLTAGTSKELGVLSGTIKEVCSEYALRRRIAKKRKLRWRSKKSLGWVPFKSGDISFTNGSVNYRNLDNFRVFQPERLPAKYGAGEFCEDSRGRWYLCIYAYSGVVLSEATSEVGIDLGLKTLATLSNGVKISGNRHYRAMERRLANAQKSRKKRLTRTINAKIKNRRLDELHKATTKVVKENALIVVGKLSAKKLTQTKMAKSVHDSATTMFKTMLKYKASAHGRCYVEVNEAYTTRTCSSCRAIPASAPRGVKGLSVREWVCCECGSVHDRDVNAALNILRIGRDALALK